MEQVIKRVTAVAATGAATLLGGWIVREVLDLLTDQAEELNECSTTKRHWRG